MLWIYGSKKKAFFNSINWYRDDLSIVFTSLGSLRNEEEGGPALHKKTKSNEGIFSLAWNIIFSDNRCGIFEPKSWWKFDIYWLQKSYYFNLFENGKYGLFLSQKVDWKMIFTDYWKGLVLNFSVMENTVFFEPRSWWKDDIYWLRRSSCFELFGDGKYGLFYSRKVDGKIIFIWSFWAFYDIPEEK